MKISIITTAYNVAPYIDRNLQYSFRQTYNDVELIIVEDCSTDNTLSLIKDFIHQNDTTNKIKLIENKTNLGAGKSRQIGLDNSTGDYIIFVDSDDYIDFDFIERVVECINNNQDYKLIATPVIFHDGDETRLTKPLEIRLQGLFIHKDIWKETNYSPLRFLEDTNTMHRCLNIVDYKYLESDVSGVHYCKRGDSLTTSASKNKCIIYNFLAALENIKWGKNKNLHKNFKRIYNSDAINLFLIEVFKIPRNEFPEEFAMIDEYYKPFTTKFRELIDRKLKEKQSLKTNI